MEHSTTSARRRRTPTERDYIARPPKWLVERAKANPMLLFSEARWQREVVKALRQLGWTLIYHTHNSQHSEAGFPDLIAFKVGGRHLVPRLLVAELKRENGKTTPAQETWLQAWRDYGAEAFVWRPSDWNEVLLWLAD